MYSVKMHNPAKKHIDLRACSREIEPMKKAIALVADVMVIDGPACVSPILNLLSASRCNGA